MGMLERNELFTIDAEVAASIPEGLPLVIALTGFADAGGAVEQLIDYTEDNNDPREFVRFNMDLLHDYRARRPTILFDQDHLTNYDGPSLTLSIATDDVGRPFLLLRGSEPDFRWEQFVATMLQLISDLKVSSTVWVHAIPMPTPHTRSISVTVSGSRSELIEARSVWRPTTQVPATVGHLLEQRLQNSGATVTGFVLLVSHYLADAEYPAALLAALECIAEASELIFATDALREQSREFIASIDEQIASNEESAEMVARLEERHDAYMQDQEVRSPLMTQDGTVPTAEELASELESFLEMQVQSKRKQDGSRGTDSLGRHAEPD